MGRSSYIILVARPIGLQCIVPLWGGKSVQVQQVHVRDVLLCSFSLQREYFLNRLVLLGFLLQTADLWGVAACLSSCLLHAAGPWRAIVIL